MDRPLVITLLAGMLLSGCEGSLDAAGVSDTGASGTEEDTGDLNDDTSEDTDTLATAAWFSLGANLTLTDGVLEDLELVLDFHDGSEELMVDCQEIREVAGVLASTSTPDPSIFHWWWVTLGAPTVSCVSPGQLPEDLYLGLGSLHPEVGSRLLRRGLEGVAGSLYGAYALVENDQLDRDAADQLALAYGYAGTEEGFTGDTVAVTAGPLPDGVYEVSGVFLFPLQ